MQDLVLLKGIFTLKEKIILFDKYGIEIDNPRSKEEIESVYNKVSQNIDICSDYQDIPYFYPNTGELRTCSDNCDPY